MDSIASQAFDNVRVQRLLGCLPKKGKATLENIPEGKDLSNFSCERYKFFLEAPFEISQQCCRVMKKDPAKRYARETGRLPITAQMATESRLRTQIWLKNGCNAFEAKRKMSNPMSFWTEQDVLLYLYNRKIPIAKCYGEIVPEEETDGQLTFESLGIFETERPTLCTTGCHRTGCMFCLYGAHLEKPGEGRLEKLRVTHPKQYDYIMRPKEDGGLNYKEVIDWTNEHGNLHIRY